MKCVDVLADNGWYEVSGAADYLELGRDEFSRVKVDSSKVHGSRTDPREDHSDWH